MADYSKEDILQRIPHREPFLWVDQIEAVEGDSIVTSKIVADDLDIFKGHYPGNPIMPGVLLCEAIFQSGALLLCYMRENGRFVSAGTVPVITRIEGAKFKRIVLPGDLLEINVKVKEILSNVCFMRGTIRVDGKIAVQTNFACTVTDSA
ncbi:3-hydroxyacyl-ACP dehydratase FabZ [Desulfopila sp. IMCC35008]|uniref:3-hydroxyacyl-ACP dehydratase FabZ n=1 Tax=Desulfopila sp. IMCC35008 TaxID=2653858 RepID=UPI001F113170|nr:3-hydroxyacyl-ACP dehydratase FabZ [Desulfopila sp. IMCC35008]